jgi:hypothetical protein
MGITYLFHYLNFYIPFIFNLIMPQARKLSAKDNKRLLDSHHETFYGKTGVFSGTDTCECGGNVKYNASTRTNFLRDCPGYCERCGKEYIDVTGRHKNPSVDGRPTADRSLAFMVG